MYTWTFKSNSLPIRLYKALYLDDGDEYGLNHITFCKLFWGTVCSPVVLLFYGVLTVGGLAVHGVKSLSGGSKPKTKRVKTAKEKAAKIPEKTGSFFDRVYAFFQAHPWVGTFLSVFLWALLIGVIAGALSFGGYEAAHHVKGFVHGLEIFGASVGLLVTTVAVCAGLGAFLVYTSTGSVVSAVLGNIGLAVWAVLCLIGRSLRFVYRFVETGHHALKYRTCPLIKVVD